MPARRKGRAAEGPAVPAVLGRDFVAALPDELQTIAVLDRTKEPGATGEPLYWTWSRRSARCRRQRKKVIGGRYGLSSKEFTPAMVKAVFDELKKKSPKNHFTVGINDDVTHTSLDLRSRILDRRPRTRCAHCSTAWARTARWAPTRTRSRSSAKRRRTSRRDISFTTRRSRARSPFRTCASGPSRSAPAT